MIIDFHTHIFPPAIKEAREEVLKVDPAFTALYSRPHSRMATAEELIEEMDRCQVERAVVLNITWTSAELCRQSNDYILQAVARYPQRLLGFISLPLPLGDVTLREMERCLPGGIKGLGELRLDVAHFTPRTRAVWEPVMAETRRLGLILLLHASEPAGHVYPGKGKVTPGLLYKFLSLFPGIKTVCAHWGGGLPFYSLIPEVASVLKDVYFDSAASSLLYKPAILHYVSQLVGADHILFGSDFPLMSQKKALDYVNSAEIDAETKAKLLGLNAHALLGTNQGG